MTTWIAQDNFVGETPEGAWVTVTKGQPVPPGSPAWAIVALDREAADAAAKAGVSRTALFAPMDFGEPEPEPPKPEPKAAPPKAAPPRKGA
jgi:hypothetical protein